MTDQYSVPYEDPHRIVTKQFRQVTVQHGTGGNTVRGARQRARVSRASDPQYDRFNSVTLDGRFVLVCTLDDEEIVRLTTESVPEGDHVGFGFEGSLVAKT